MATDGTPNWSELVPDIWSLVFKHLNYTDFTRAKTVCWSWYSASKSSSPRENQVPWLILYEDTYWLLFNSEEGKFYRTQSLGRFAECRAGATCGSWVLVFDKQANFYILNPFTPKIIHLPPLESNRTAEFRRRDNYSFDVRVRRTGAGWTVTVIVETAVLWVDPKTKDYLVVWSYKKGLLPGPYVCYCRKGEEEWFEIPASSTNLIGCLDMAYKDKKLYILTYNGSIRILDFSLGDLPIEVDNNPYAHRPFNPKHIGRSVGMRLTTSGDVLMILRGISNVDKIIRFYVYKMSSTREYWEKFCSGQTEEPFWLVASGATAEYWERVHSLEEEEEEEEEALVWDLSVTLPTKGVSGIKKDSVYYCHNHNSSSREVAAYEIPTHKISAYEIPKQTVKPILHRDLLTGNPNVRWFVPCGLLIADARWFVPCFGAGE